MKSESSNPQLSLWPFILAIAVLIGIASAIGGLASRHTGALYPWEFWGIVLCGILAVLLFIFLFVRRSRDAQNAAQYQKLLAGLERIQKIDQVAEQITNATSRWQQVQEHASKANDNARELATAMSTETKRFAEVLEHANDSEKNHLRVEVDKLRRAEVEWLQAMTRIMDHVYALYLGAKQSGQRNLIEQIGQFQNACRDAARRVGLIPQIAAPGDAYDPQIHQVIDGATVPEGKPVVAITIITGYSYQGQLVRRPVVGLKDPSKPETPETPEPPKPEAVG